MLDESDSDAQEAERKLDSERMKKIEETINSENKELKEQKKITELKQAIMKDFIAKGIVKESEIIDNLSQEAFIVLYHFNKKLPDKYRALLPNNEKPIDTVLRELNFVPVGSFAGAYFFHIVNAKLLPKDLRQPTFLEVYIKRKVRRSWNIIETELKKRNRREYNDFKQNSSKKVNLIYLIGRIFASELRIGYLNYSNFDKGFLPYMSGFVNPKMIKKEVNNQKLNALLTLASLDYFVALIEDSRDRSKIITNEVRIKRRFGVGTLTEYDGISKEQWLKQLSMLFEERKARVYANEIYDSIKRVLPIIKEYV
jgi:hypothetical protein